MAGERLLGYDSAMRSGFVSSAFLIAAAVSLPLPASAHTGGALDHYGCHADHRKGDYHCHNGNLRGYTFPSRDALHEAMRTGNFPEKPPHKEGFFEKLWPFGKTKADSAPAADPAPVAEPAAAAEPAPEPAPEPARVHPQAAAAAAPTAAPAAVAPAPAAAAPPRAAVAPAPAVVPAQPAAVAPAPAPAPAPAAQGRSFEERLKVLSGLRDMGLITQDEYDARRKAILDEL